MMLRSGLNTGQALQTLADQRMTLVHVTSSLRRRGAEVYAVELARAIAGRAGGQAIFALVDGTAELSAPAGVELQVARGSKRPASMRALRSLRGYLSSLRGDVTVVGHGLTATKMAVLASLGRPGTRIVFQKIGFTRPWLRRFASVRLMWTRWILSRAHACIVIGDKQTEEAATLLHVPRSRVFLVPNARPRPVLDDRIERQGSTIAFVGALSDEKNPRLALDILAHVRSEGHDARLRFVGDGPLRGALEREARERGLGAGVEFAGVVDNIWPSLQEAGFLLLCSRTEGVPGVAVEAALAGLPVVCWDVGDVASVVEHGIGGLVVAYGDEAALKGATVSMLADPAMARSLGANALRESGRFDIESAARSTLEVIAGLR